MRFFMNHSTKRTRNETTVAAKYGLWLIGNTAVLNIIVCVGVFSLCLVGNRVTTVSIFVRVFFSFPCYFCFEPKMFKTKRFVVALKD